MNDWITWGFISYLGEEGKLNIGEVHKLSDIELESLDVFCLSGVEYVPVDVESVTN